MHQHPRPSPVSASSATSPRTISTRTNTSREADGGGSRASSDKGTPTEQGVWMAEGSEASSREHESTANGKEQVAKLSQVVQNYFTKASLIILHSRVALPPAYSKDSRTKRVNKWFNVEIDETDLIRDDVRRWRSCEAIANRPPPMVIETFIDTHDLTNNQSLVIIDEHGKRWDIEEALNKSPSSSNSGKDHTPRNEVIVERWTIQLGDFSGKLPQDLGTILPRTYKNSVVLFRSLYAFARLLPAWRYGKRLFKDRSSTKIPKLKYRVLEHPHSTKALHQDQLSVPLFESPDDVLESFSFDPIDSPAGSLSIKVTYRSNCDFRIVDSEAFLSSRFIGMDEDYFAPSLGRRRDLSRQEPVQGKAEVGSLPPARRDNVVRPDQGQAYGSMSTFHNMGPPTGTSPISALRAARAAGSESPEEMIPKRAPPNTRSAQGSRSSLRSADGASGVGRRPSVSFMPFKSPSLSASPSQGEQLLTSVPRGSLGKSSPLAALAEARAPPNLSPSGSALSRGSPNMTDQTIPPSISSSPKPGALPRYSSSFGHRKSKLSTGGSSRTEDDNSSGKASLTSSNAQPGSGVIAEGGGASSGSIQTDDDNISDFLKLLDQKKDLKSFKPSDEQAAAEASTRRTSAALTKFQRMRDSNDALSNSMYSSLHVHRSSSTSSRQLSSVPPMIAGTSQSTSSSPGKPISPHTPHTPTIPSRLSANSTVEYNQQPSRNDRNRAARPVRTDESDASRSPRDQNTGAIDIPTSPRPYNPSYRRSSSAVQQPRTAQYEEDDPFPFGMRSASLGMDDRPTLSLSALAALQDTDVHDESAVGNPSVEERDYAFGPMFDPAGSGDAPISRQRSSSFDRRDAAASAPARGVYRPRIGRGSGRGSTPPQASSSSLVERGSASGGSSDYRGGRYSFTRPPSTFEEEEPLLFAMSDFDATQQSRRSLEEARGGKGSYERSGEDSGGSSRRGSKRGGY